MTPARPRPLEIRDCTLITLALGRTAQDLRELGDRVLELPAESIYHHFYHTLLRPTFDDPEYRNDFALWARRHLHDSVLAERLGIIDPIDHEDLERLRQHLLEVIETRLFECHAVPSAAPNHEMHFLRSQVVVFSTGRRAETPEDLAAMIPRLSTGCIFYHFVEARRRSPARSDDFSSWLEGWGPDHETVRHRIEAIDFHLWSLSEMRERIAECFPGTSHGASTR
jgi:hypothetical protein